MIKSLGPGMSDATTGTLQLAASIITEPKPSRILGRIKTSKSG